MALILFGVYVISLYNIYCAVCSKFYFYSHKTPKGCHFPLEKQTIKQKTEAVTEEQQIRNTVCDKITC